jgi:hypothetical protein
VHLVGFLFIIVIADARNHEPEICIIELYCIVSTDAPQKYNEKKVNKQCPLTCLSTRHQRRR